MNCFCLSCGLKSKPHLFPGALNSPANSLIKAIINIFSWRSVLTPMLLLWFVLFVLNCFERWGENFPNSSVAFWNVFLLLFLWISPVIQLCTHAHSLFHQRFQSHNTAFLHCVASPLSSSSPPPPKPPRRLEFPVHHLMYFSSCPFSSTGQFQLSGYGSAER